VDVPLEDIERIEVIRGPGATTWGANAVNGVINIITKRASATRGGMLVAGGGNVDRGTGTAQYGGSIGKHTDYRIFAKYSDHSAGPGVFSLSGEDQWNMLSGGFRADSKLSSRDDLTVQGNVYDGRQGEVLPALAANAPPGSTVASVFPMSGQSIQADWNHSYANRSDSTLRVAYDRYSMDDMGDSRSTFDLEFDHRLAWGERQELVWGLDYRYSSSLQENTAINTLIPAALTTQLFSAFLQDEFALIPDRLTLTVGTKLEHNYYTGLGLMPSVRLGWNPSQHQLVWASVSRALRSPSRLDTSLQVNVLNSIDPATGLPVLVRYLGDPNFQNEKLVAYEAGYRIELHKRVSFDLSAYYNSYNDLANYAGTALPGFLEFAPPPVHLVLPLQIQNTMYGETHGLEISTNWKPTRRWSLTPSYAFERTHMHLNDGTPDPQSKLGPEGRSPIHWARLDSHLDLSRRLGWDASATFLDHLPMNEGNWRIPTGDAPSYVRVDSQFTWRLGESLTLGLIGQNLLKDHHIEFQDPLSLRTFSQVKRGVCAKLTWWF
jgi:iron complex outermembrane receptor protein